MANPYDQFDDRTKDRSNPFDQFDLDKKKQIEPASVIDSAADFSKQLVHGVNRGLNSLVAIPGALSAAAVEAVGIDGDKLRWKNNSISDFMERGGKPSTTAGQYGESVGRTIGASAVPMGGVLVAAARPAGQVAASTLGQIGQRIVDTARHAPGAYVAGDVASATGAGIAEQYAENQGAGVLGKALAGVAGGMVPGIAMAYRRPSGDAIGSPTAQSIASRRAQSAVDDAAAFDDLDIRTFGPSFNQGPIASVGKQLTETPFIGAPLRNNMDETFHDAAGAARRIAADISPNATAESAGTSLQRGLDRYRTAGFRDLDRATVDDLGINPVQPVQVPQHGGRAQLQRIRNAQADIDNVTGGVVENSRGQPVPLPQTMTQRTAARTGVDDLSDAELATVIRAPSDLTSFGARSEALYERAWRSLPPLRRSNGSADPMALPTENAGAVARQIAAEEARTGVRAGIQGRYGDMFDTLANPQANVPLDTIRQMRTAIGRDLSNFGTYEASLDRTQLRRLYGALSADLEVGLQDIAARAARSLGTPHGVTPDEVRRAVQGLRDFQVADRYFRQGIDRMDRFARLAQAENPQQAAAMMVRAANDGLRGNARMFRAAMAVLRPEERAQFGSLVVQEMGRPINSARGLIQESGFSPSSFVTRYEAMSPEARNLIFTPEHQRSLDQLFRVASRLANVEALANTSRSGTNAINMTGLAGTVGSLAAGNVVTPLAIGGGGYAASVLMSLPEYTRWMTRYLHLRAAVSNGSSAAVAPLARHVMGLERNARYNPDLWPAYMIVAQDAENTAPSRPTERRADGGAISDARYVSQARNAVLRGADPAAVAQRLQELGVTNDALG